MSGEITVSITTAEGYEPSPRLRAALERLARLAEPDDASAAEVEPFELRLTVGPDTMGGEPSSWWREGCWGYEFGPGGQKCGWFEIGDAKCVCHGWLW